MTSMYSSKFVTFLAILSSFGRFSKIVKQLDFISLNNNCKQIFVKVKYIIHYSPLFTKQSEVEQGQNEVVYNSEQFYLFHFLAHYSTTYVQREIKD